MRFRTVLSLATLFAFCFTLAVWSQPLPSSELIARTGSGVESESVSGKISSIGDASFSVDVVKNQDLNTVQFLIDGNTKVDGKLAVGAQATVEYRSDDGKNVAIHVVVQKTAGHDLY
jgi:hypothetical protein